MSAATARMFVLVGLLVACGTPTPAPSNNGPATATKPADDNVEDVATRLGRAAFKNDRAAALALTLTYADAAKLSNKAPESNAAEWDAEVKDFFDHLAKEAGEHKFEITGAKVTKTDTLSPGKDEKVKRAIDYALVQLVIALDGEAAEPRGIPMLFLKTDAGWRFSPKQ
jgi:hypothetical protein